MLALGGDVWRTRAKPGGDSVLLPPFHKILVGKHLTISLHLRKKLRAGVRLSPGRDSQDRPPGASVGDHDPGGRQEARHASLRQQGRQEFAYEDGDRKGSTRQEAAHLQAELECVSG